ncbi:MAG: hypothetical protein JEZ09_18110 [Salinivirgaceae bacterium]|nr:hypothetical protein [Salinivirgaceae bacterium]
MKKVILCLHGLGNKPPKELLQQWWKDAINEGLLLINEDKKLPAFEMIYWADVVYKKPLDETITDENDPYYMDEPYAESPSEIIEEPHSFRKKIIDFVSEEMNKIFLNKDLSLNYSFISDAILKKYFRDLDIYYSGESTDENSISYQARQVIRDRTVQAIQKYKGYEILLIAHSMGSIIAFDTLSFLIPESKIHSLVTIGSPLGLPIVKNKIYVEQKSLFPGKNKLETPPNITHNWYNYADIMDNVALDYKLADDFLKNKNEIGPVDFLINNNYEINGAKNPHKSYGYLRTPEFSKMLSEFIGIPELTFIQRIARAFKKLLKRMFGKIDAVKISN